MIINGGWVGFFFFFPWRIKGVGGEMEWNGGVFFFGGGGGFLSFGLDRLCSGVNSLIAIGSGYWF
jgi:hypothetical protein